MSLGNNPSWGIPMVKPWMLSNHRDSSFALLTRNDIIKSCHSERHEARGILMMVLLNLSNLRDSSSPMVLRMTLTHNNFEIVLRRNRSEIFDI
jgi:hypothetical protein